MKVRVIAGVRDPNVSDPLCGTWIEFVSFPMTLTDYASDDPGDPKITVNDEDELVAWARVAFEPDALEYDATRLWWGFYMYGKTDARVLDGGYQAWKAAGYDVERHLINPKAERIGNFVAKARRETLMASMDDIWRAKTDPEVQLWDTREKNEWTGEKLKKGAFRKGRIPWAEFLNWKEFKKPVAEGEQPTLFKDAREVKKVVNGSLRAGDLVVVVASENMREGAPMIVVRGLPDRGKSPRPGPAKKPSPPASQPSEQGRR